MVGCPSLLVSESSAPPAVEGHIVVGFHRHGRCEQVIFFRKLALQKQRPLRILVQEVSERPAAALLAEETGGELIELAQLRSRADWQKVFVGASECISGRLHQVLPAAALGVPSLLILPDSTAAGDSRFSLLQHLGIPMQVLRTKEDEALLPKSANAPKLQQMVAALRGWLTDLQTDPQRLRTPRAIPASSDQYRDLEQRLRESITLGETLTDRCEDQAASVRAQQDHIRELQAKLQKYRGDTERKKQLIERLQETVQQLQARAHSAIEKSATAKHQ